MKKILLIILLFVLNFLPVFARADRMSAEYLRSKKHFSIMNPVAESAAQKIIKKALKKEVGNGDYKVKFSAYTLSSLRKGIFKSIQILGRDLDVENIPVPYIKVRTITDYNWIDITEKPPKIKSDMIFAYEMELTEKSINKALEHKNYQKILENLNKKAYPLFTMHNVRVKIRHNKLLVIMEYSLPLASVKKKKSFMVSTSFKVDEGKIIATDIGIDNVYGNLPLEKVTNLINLVNPLSFTMDQLNENNCKAKIENVKIIDDIILVNGKIFIEKR